MIIVNIYQTYNMMRLITDENRKFPTKYDQVNLE